MSSFKRVIGKSAPASAGLNHASPYYDFYPGAVDWDAVKDPVESPPGESLTEVGVDNFPIGPSGLVLDSGDSIRRESGTGTLAHGFYLGILRAMEFTVGTSIKWYGVLAASGVTWTIDAAINVFAVNFTAIEQDGKKVTTFNAGSTGIQFFEANNDLFEGSFDVASNLLEGIFNLNVTGWTNPFYFWLAQNNQMNANAVDSHLVMLAANVAEDSGTAVLHGSNSAPGAAGLAAKAALESASWTVIVTT